MPNMFNIEIPAELQKEIAAFQPRERTEEVQEKELQRHCWVTKTLSQGRFVWGRTPEGNCFLITRTRILTLGEGQTRSDYHFVGEASGCWTPAEKLELYTSFGDRPVEYNSGYSKKNTVANDTAWLDSYVDQIMNAIFGKKRS